MDKQIQAEYRCLLNKTKKQIVEELGQELNFYPYDIWRYRIKENWWGRKTTLLIYFKNETAHEIKIIKHY